MKTLVNNINSNQSEKDKFIDFMHKQEYEIKDYIKKCNDESNNFAMKLIFEFAEKEGMQLKDDESVKKVMYRLCKKTQVQVYRDTVKQFNTLINKQ